MSSRKVIKMTNYPIVIHKDRDSDYGVTVPDLPGCYTAGSTLGEALAMAQEAIELHLEGLIEHGDPVPRPGSIDDYRDNPDYKDGTWAIVSVSPSHLRVKAKRINVSIPKRTHGGRFPYFRESRLFSFAAPRGPRRQGGVVRHSPQYFTGRSARRKHIRLLIFQPDGLRRTSPGRRPGLRGRHSPSSFIRPA
jgi:predicted RNase H-like HicB family nuclease